MLTIQKPQKVNTKGAVVIPKKVRQIAGIGPSSRLVFSFSKSGKISIEAITEGV